MTSITNTLPQGVGIEEQKVPLLLGQDEQAVYGRDRTSTGKN